MYINNRCTEAEAWDKTPSHDDPQYEDFLDHLSSCEYHSTLDEEEPEQAESLDFILEAMKSLSPNGKRFMFSGEEGTFLQANLKKLKAIFARGDKISALEFRADGNALARLDLVQRLWWGVLKHNFNVSSQTRSIQIWEPRAQVLLATKLIGWNSGASRVEKHNFNGQTMTISEEASNDGFWLKITCDPATVPVSKEVFTWCRRKAGFALLPAAVLALGIKGLWQDMCRPNILKLAAYAVNAISCCIAAKTPATLATAVVMAAVVVISYCISTKPWIDTQSSPALTGAAVSERPATGEKTVNIYLERLPVSNTNASLSLAPVTQVNQRMVRRHKPVVVKDNDVNRNKPVTEEVLSTTPPPMDSTATEVAAPQDVTYYIQNGGEAVDIEAKSVPDKLYILLKEDLSQDQTIGIVSDPRQAQMLVSNECFKDRDNEQSKIITRIHTRTAEGKEQSELSKDIETPILSCEATPEELKRAAEKISEKLKMIKNLVVALRNKETQETSSDNSLED